MVMAGLVLVVIAVILIIVGITNSAIGILLWIGIGLLVVGVILALFDRMRGSRVS